jgi:hypothetical protein
MSDIKFLITDATGATGAAAALRKRGAEIRPI